MATRWRAAFRRAVMAEMYGKANGCSRGRGGSMHLFDASRRFYGGNAIVGGGLPLAVGLALADRCSSVPPVTACFFGDGAVAEGEFHESLNLAALWKLPVLFLCENNLLRDGNGRSPGIRRRPTSAGRARATAFPRPRWTAWTCVAVERGGRARPPMRCARGGGPFLLECRTYRFRAHSMYDPELYRDKDEVEQWKRRDPITLFTDPLRGRGTADGARPRRSNRKHERPGRRGGRLRRGGGVGAGRRSAQGRLRRGAAMTQ